MSGLIVRYEDNRIIYCSFSLIRSNNLLHNLYLGIVGLFRAESSPFHEEVVKHEEPFRNGDDRVSSPAGRSPSPRDVKHDITNSDHYRVSRSAAVVSCRRHLCL